MYTARPIGRPARVRWQGTLCVNLSPTGNDRSEREPMMLTSAMLLPTLFADAPGLSAKERLYLQACYAGVAMGGRRSEPGDVRTSGGEA